MCIKSICNLISALSQTKQTQQQPDKAEQTCGHTKPPEKPCYEKETNTKSISYEFSHATLSIK